MMAAWQERALARLNADRDPSLLLGLAESGMLTTSQLVRLHFPSAGTARHRLCSLRDLGLITGLRVGGSWASECSWSLTTRGAQLLTLLLGEAVHAGASSKQASARALPHRQASAAFFTALLPKQASGQASKQAGELGLVPVRHRGYQRFGPVHPGEASTMWLGERSCRIVFGSNDARPWGARTALVPDGAALLASGPVHVPFAVEIDRGTESTRILSDKLRRYDVVAGAGLVVLVCFTDPAKAAGWQPPATKATVLVGDLPGHLATPWGAVWRTEVGERVGLGELAGGWR
jgi:hypothetical protein